MQEQNCKTVPSERGKLNKKVEEGKQSAFNCITVEQDRRCTYESNIEALSRNHCRRGKPISIIL